MHLADVLSKAPYSAFRLYIYQYVCSLGIEPTTFALLTQCSTRATGKIFPDKGQILMCGIEVFSKHYII